MSRRAPQPARVPDPQLACGDATSSDAAPAAQFFITFRKAEHLDGKHVVFGKVVEGMKVVLEVEQQTTTDNDRPAEPVIISRCGEMERIQIEVEETESEDEPEEAAPAPPPEPQHTDSEGEGDDAESSSSSSAPKKKRRKKEKRKREKEKKIKKKDKKKKDKDKKRKR